MSANVSKPTLKLVATGGVRTPLPAVAHHDDRSEYFCMRMEDDRPTETHGPFPSEQAAVDAVNQWYGDGEWYICAKTKALSKKENAGGKTH